MTHEILNANQTQYNHVLAFEISKAEHHVHSEPAGDSCKIANDRATIRRLIKKEMRRNAKLDIGPLLVICEATGSYSLAVLEVAAELGVACHRAHGSRVRAFARFRGTHAKSDPIDVRVIADFGCSSKGLLLYAPPRAEQVELRELVERRTELRQTKEAEENRVEHVRSKVAADSLRAHIRWLDGVLAKIDKRIDELVKTDEYFRKTAKLMQSVHGVGRVTAVTVLAHLPEIGTVSAGTIAALAGLAPFECDSGVFKGQRHIFGGREEARTGLYMAAKVAMVGNAHLRALAERIQARGKPFKVAATAVMRKLLIILNAIVASGQPCRMQNAT